jgi:hypothetical protein
MEVTPERDCYRASVHNGERSFTLSEPRPNKRCEISTAMLDEKMFAFNYECSSNSR